MKKLFILPILLFILIFTTGCGNIENEKQENQLNIVTSFYPIYIATLNITEGVDVNLSNLTNNHTGCLHEYTLTTSDLVKIETADIFVINGLGVETFTDKIVNTYSNIQVINSSDGIDIEHEEAGHNHKHDHAHDHENGHIWLDIEMYKQQIQNICNQLSEINPENSEKYIENANAYILKLNDLDTLMKSELDDINNKGAICLNEAFELFGESLNLKFNIIETGHNEESSLSGAQIADILDTMQKDNINAIFIENMDSDIAANTIVQQNNAKMFRLDAHFARRK